VPGYQLSIPEAKTDHEGRFHCATGPAFAINGLEFWFLAGEFQPEVGEAWQTIKQQIVKISFWSESQNLAQAHLSANFFESKIKTINFIEKTLPQIYENIHYSNKYKISNSKRELLIKKSDRLWCEKNDLIDEILFEYLAEIQKREKK
jgi:hypothetical protein